MDDVRGYRFPSLSRYRGPSIAAWFLAQLEAASLQGPLVMNDLSVRYDRIEDVAVARTSLRHYALLRKHSSSRARLSNPTEDRVVRVRAFCPISSSEPMLPVTNVFVDP